MVRSPRRAAFLSSTASRVRDCGRKLETLWQVGTASRSFVASADCVRKVPVPAPKLPTVDKEQTDAPTYSK
jgi:hypothetical protein